MKWSTLGITLAMATAGSVVWSAPLWAQATCTNDTQCTTNGTTCGTYVCSWATATHHCVAASTGDPGWCGGGTATQAAADMTCKCRATGATCNTATHFCTFTMPTDAGGGGGDSGAGDSGSAGDTGTPDGGGTVPIDAAGAPDASGSSSGSGGSSGSGSGSGGSSGSGSSSGATGSSSGSGSSSGGSSGAVSTSSSSGSSSGGAGGGDAGTTPLGTSSSGCSCTVGSSTPADWAIGALTLGGCLALVRRRRRN